MRFVGQARNAFIMGPVGVGKTFMATALGHIACRRRISVHFERHDRLHKRLKAARLDASYDQEMRKLIGVDLLVIDDFALQPLDMLETADVYELCVERHHAKATVLTSNRDPSEWLASHGRPPARPIRRRPAQKRGVGAGHRRRVLSPAREANPRNGSDRRHFSTPASAMISCSSPGPVVPGIPFAELLGHLSGRYFASRPSTSALAT